ncbi:PepSY domain-containing protein [Nonomuraea dietziae]|uniref:PepSY domain-containing protein n=1 Tax=Nonomuraea dietziae TaxID=65515 RepID=UPI0033ED0DD8
MYGGRGTKTIIGTILAGSALFAASACASDTQSGTFAAQRDDSRAAAEKIAGLASPTGMPPGTPTGYPTGEPSPGEPSPGEPSPGDASPGAGAADLRKAGTAATEAVEGGTIISIEAEDDGRLWEVHVVGSDGVEQQLDVDAESGDVVSGPTAEDDEAEEKARLMALVKGAELTYEEAAEKVATAVPGGKITELSLDRHEGKVVWEADVTGSDGTKQEVKVDAKDGTVTKNGSTS